MIRILHLLTHDETVLPFVSSLLQVTREYLQRLSLQMGQPQLLNGRHDFLPQNEQQHPLPALILLRHRDCKCLHERMYIACYIQHLLDSRDFQRM